MATRLPTTPKMNITAGMVTGLFGIKEEDVLVPGVVMMMAAIHSLELRGWVWGW